MVASNDKRRPPATYGPMNVVAQGTEEPLSYVEHVLCAGAVVKRGNGDIASVDNVLTNLAQSISKTDHPEHSWAQSTAFTVTVSIKRGSDEFNHLAS
jgi:hypothetical protein